MIITEHRAIVFPNDEKSKALAERTEKNFKNDEQIHWATHLDIWPEQCVLTLTATFYIQVEEESDTPEEPEVIN